METNTPDPSITDFSKEIGRLNRVLGQIEGIKKMITEHRSYADIMSQLHATRSAIHSVEANILKTYLLQCAAQGFNSEQDCQKKIDELRELFNRYYD